MKNTQTKMQPPSCPEAEIQLIGGLIQWPKALQKVAALCRVDDLYRPAHRVIYQAMFDLEERSEPIDAISLQNVLREGGRLNDAGGSAYLAELIEKTPTAANIEHHARIVREASQKRALIKVCHDIQSRAYGTEKANSLSSELMEEIADISRDGDTASETFISARELLSMKTEAEVPILKDGILPVGGGMLINAESGHGKSLLRLELAIRLVMGWEWLGIKIPRSRRVLIVQFENTLATEKFRLSKMLNGLEISSLPDAHLKFSDPKLRLDLKLKGERKKALEIVRRSKAEVVIWDPLSSIHSANENENIPMRDVLDTITAINRETGASAIVIHHFNKQTDQETAWRHRGASSIRDWADTAIALTPKAHEHKILRLLEFTKIRNGPHRKAVLLERDENFIHHATEDDVMCAPERVKEILGTLGGRVNKQGELIQAISREVGCSPRRAFDFVKNAIGRSIDEFASTGRAKGYKTIE